MAESYENLRIADEGRIRIVTIDRPKVLNALNDATLKELDRAFADVAANTEVGGAILTGGGEKSFVAGADINELKDLGPLAAKTVAGFGQEVFSRIERLGKPVVAAVNGFAFGGGLELACACTFRVASHNALMGLPEVKLGIIPGYGGTQRLLRIAGPGVAREWILTGDMFPAEEAWRVGIVNRIFEPAELREGTMKLVRTILARGPVAVRFAMEAVNRGSNMPQAEGERLECDLFGLAASTADMKEGMGAFLEKRKPAFQGR